MNDVILVTGATGQIGRAVAQRVALRSKGPEVRFATRDPGSHTSRTLAAMDSSRLRPVLFDGEDPASLASALCGVRKVLVIPPVSPTMDLWHDPLAHALKRAESVEYLVKVSVLGARPPDSEPPPGPYPRMHHHGEALLRDTGIPLTIIRPTMFMQHFLFNPGLYRAGEDRIYLPSGSGRIALLDCRDIATAAIELLTAPAASRFGWEGVAFDLTGPVALSGPEMAEELSLMRGRELKWVDGLEAYRTHCSELGIEPGLGALYQEADHGWFENTEHAAYTRLTGLRPTSFASFALDNAAHFGPRP